MRRGGACRGEGEYHPQPPPEESRDLLKAPEEKTADPPEGLTDTILTQARKLRYRFSVDWPEAGLSPLFRRDHLRNQTLGGASQQVLQG